MKLNKLLLMAAMGLGLFACNDNDLVEGSGPNGAQNEGTTYVAFSIDFNKMGTRADDADGEIPKGEQTIGGTEAESKITTAAVVLAEVGTITQVVTTAEDNGKYMFKTTAGEHEFYAIVNYDKAPEVGNSISDYFETAEPLSVVDGGDYYNVTTPNKFMMSSCEKKTFYINDNVTKEQALNGEGNNFTIPVQRVAAKITMTCPNTILDEEGNKASGEISAPKFYLYNIAKKAFRMASSSVVCENAYEDYYANANNPFDVCTNILEDKTTYAESAAPAYCLENLHNEIPTGATTKYTVGNSTYVTLCTTFKPTNVVNCDNPLGGLTGNTHAEGTGDDLSFYVVKEGLLAGCYLMKKDLDTFQAKDGNSGKYPEGVDGISEVYTNGVCWFGPIWIGEESESGEAPVVRNYWYNLNITGIDLPGSDKEFVIEEEDKNDPLHPATNVAIKLDVMPWNYSNRDINLK